MYQRDYSKMATPNTGFASGGVNCKLVALCFYSCSVLVDSFVLRNSPERKTRKPQKGLLHHSDRGSQDASNEYQQLLKDKEICCSMSRKGNCYDNAVMESFFATLKRELVYHRLYQNRKEAKQDIFEYIEVWYNRKRMHSTLGYMSPHEFENKSQHLLAA